MKKHLNIVAELGLKPNWLSCIAGILGFILGEYQLVYGQINFSPYTKHFVMQDSRSGRIELADFNYDGNLDMAMSNNSGLNYEVSLMQGDGVGGFVAGFLPTFTLSPPNRVIFGDINADSRVDIVASAPNSNPFFNTFTYLNDGLGNFTQFNSSTNAIPLDILLADFNQDNFLDLARAIDNQISIALGNGLGSFSSPVNYPVSSLGNPDARIIAGDFNYDGRVDIAAISSGNSQIAVLLGNGLGSLSAATYFTTTNAPIAL
ncbi:MAG: VCBS repeat-containing protein [Microscillaceae bacterium]|jgi:hypothetical protein|nr:VCBS repeat-containing protein [Microscillaceae bacterium]